MFIPIAGTGRFNGVSISNTYSISSGKVAIGPTHDTIKSTVAAAGTEKVKKD